MEIVFGCVFCCTFLLYASRNHLNKEMNLPQPRVRLFSVTLLTLSFHYQCWSFCLSPGRLSSLQLIPLCSSLLALCLSLLLFLPIISLFLLFPFNIFKDIIEWAETEKHCSKYKHTRKFSARSLPYRQDFHRYVDTDRCGVPAKTHFTGQR